jgi:hypothetical protein
MPLRSQIIHLAAGLPKGDATRRELLAAAADVDFLEILNQKISPEQERLGERMRALQELAVGCRSVGHDVAKPTHPGPRRFKLEDGQQWPGKNTQGWPKPGTKEEAKADILTDHMLKQVKPSLERDDPVAAYFVSEWSAEGRWYVEIGIYTFGGRRKTLKKSRWNALRKMGEALANELSGMAIMMDRDRDKLNREYEALSS